MYQPIYNNENAHTRFEYEREQEKTNLYDQNFEEQEIHTTRNNQGRTIIKPRAKANKNSEINQTKTYQSRLFKTNRSRQIW